MTCLKFLENALSCLGLLEETITLFEWTKISVALFECLGLHGLKCDLTKLA